MPNELPVSASEKPQLLSLMERLRPRTEGGPTMGTRRNREYDDLLTSGRKIRDTYEDSVSKTTKVRLITDTDGTPFFEIIRETSVSDSNWDPMISGPPRGRANSTRCFSFEEYYSNLNEEEKDQGVVLGKDLERYLE